LTAAIIAAVAISAMTAAGASAKVVYNSVPKPLPGNLPSIGFQCCQMKEMGGQIGFPASTARRNPTVEVIMSSWACEKGGAEDNTCQSPAGFTFPEEVTLNIYEVQGTKEVGPKVGTLTQTFQMPYRPSASPQCTTGTAKGGWFDKKEQTCYHGKLFPIKFQLGGANALPPKNTFVLPSEKAIVSVAYNTTTHGYTPKGTQPCNSTEPPGCPYDSLNVAIHENPSAPKVGSYTDPEELYMASEFGPYFCPGPPSGSFEPTGTTGGPSCLWTDEQPLFKIKAR
jgi:hypothetical protein